ncbi:MAG: tail fiber domain-containing protein [Candidatus Pacebacteria bacterium]|nr:tail fiber domain-containing protein [Candidatus Paceibacterota bacterium]
MKFFEVCKKYSLFLFVVVALTIYGGIVVSAIAPGETLDPVGDTLCTGPTDPACAISLYDGLDPNSVLYLDGNGDITTDELFFRNEDRFLVGTATLVPGYITGVFVDDVLENEFFIGSGMIHVPDSGPSAGMNLIFNGDASGVGLSDQTTLVGYLDFDNNYLSFASFEPESIEMRLQVEDSFGDDMQNVFTITEDGFDLNAGNSSTGDYSKILLNYASGITFDFDGTSGYTFPRADGGNGEILTTDGAGQLSWETTTSLTGLTENNNTFLGIDAGLNNSGPNANTFIGYQSGYSNTTGNNNTATGLESLFANTTGFYNTAHGAYALRFNTTGSFNTATGYKSLFSNTTGEYNTGHGYQTIAFNQTGSFNTAFGYAALEAVTNNRNTANGFQSLSQTISGSDNAALGYRTGYTNLTGINNTLIGSFADVSTGNTSNAIALGFGAIAASNQFALPDSITTWKFQGESYTLPTAYPGTNGYVLSSTNAGVMSWAAQTSSPISVGTAGNTLYSSGLTGAEQGSTSSGGNIILGQYAGQNSTNAHHSNFLGRFAGASSSSVYHSNFFGEYSGNFSANANNSNFFGTFAGSSATDANNSNFFGQNAGASATSASNSNFFGQNAGSAAANSYNSTFIGYLAGASNGVDTGSQNSNNSIFIGNNAGYKTADFTLNNFTADFHSILIGDDTSTGGFSNSIALGKGATNTATNQLMIGSTLATGSIESVRIQAATTECTITTGTGIACSSDERLKTNIEDMTNILDKVLQLKTVTYNWNDRPNTDAQIGFLAQDLEQYFPELVATNEKGLKSVYYSQITPVLVAAIKEIDLKILDIQNLSDETFLSRIRNWFADAGNGIGELFVQIIRSDKVQTNELCIEDVCVTKDQLQQLLQNQNISTIYYNSSSDNTDDIDDANGSDEENNESEIIDDTTENTSNESNVNTDDTDDTDNAENIGNAPDESNVNEEPQEDTVEESNESKESAEESSNEGQPGESSESESSDSGEAPTTE